MSLTLTAAPQVVAREEVRANGSRGWVWLLEAEQRLSLNAQVRNGTASTYQRREAGGNVVLLAWCPKARQAADETAREAAATARRQEHGQAVIVRKPPARAVGGPTHAPYMHEPARWL